MSDINIACGFCDVTSADGVTHLFLGRYGLTLCDDCGDLLRQTLLDLMQKGRRSPSPAPAAPDLDVRIETLPGLSRRARNRLDYAGAPASGNPSTTLRDLTGATSGELLRVSGLGPRTLAEIEAWLAGMGLSLAGEARP